MQVVYQLETFGYKLTHEHLEFFASLICLNALNKNAVKTLSYITVSWLTSKYIIF